MLPHRKPLFFIGELVKPQITLECSRLLRILCHSTLTLNTVVTPKIIAIIFISTYTFSLKARIHSFSLICEQAQECHRNVCLLLVCTILMTTQMCSSTLSMVWCALVLCHFRGPTLLWPCLFSVSRAGCSCGWMHYGVKHLVFKTSFKFLFLPWLPWLSLTILNDLSLNAVLLWILMKIGTKSRWCTSKRAEKEKGKRIRRLRKLSLVSYISCFFLN